VVRAGDKRAALGHLPFDLITQGDFITANSAVHLLKIGGSRIVVEEAK
jgi:hypothetical protein